MNPDDFEKRLQRQPLRELPPEWRAEILKGATLSHHSPLVIRHSFLSALTSRLRTILWPHHKAWAGLAALWVVIAAVQFASNDSFQQVAKKPETLSPETLVVLQQQQRLLAGLEEPVGKKNVDRPKRGAAQPRSDRRWEILHT